MSPTSTEGEAVDVDEGAPVSTNPAEDAFTQPIQAVSGPVEQQTATPSESLAEPEGDLDTPIVEQAEIETSGLAEEPDEPGEEPLGEDAGSDEDETSSQDESAEADEPAFFDDLEESSADDEFEQDLLEPPEMSQMLFVDVVLLLPATHPVVVLQEADSPFRELRIPVGGAEGIAIGYAARGIATPRPLTHELLTRVLEEYGMTIDVVRITDVSGASYSAELVVSGPQGVREIDCRPSDAIALALRQRLPVPIVASPMVLAIAGTDPLGAN